MVGILAPVGGSLVLRPAMSVTATAGSRRVLVGFGTVVLRGHPVAGDIGGVVGFLPGGGSGDGF